MMFPELEALQANVNVFCGTIEEFKRNFSGFLEITLRDAKAKLQKLDSKHTPPKTKRVKGAPLIDEQSEPIGEAIGLDSKHTPPKTKRVKGAPLIDEQSEPIEEVICDKLPLVTTTLACPSPLQTAQPTQSKHPSQAVKKLTRSSTSSSVPSKKSSVPSKRSPVSSKKSSLSPKRSPVSSKKSPLSLKKSPKRLSQSPKKSSQSPKRLSQSPKKLSQSPTYPTLVVSLKRIDQVKSVSPETVLKKVLTPTKPPRKFRVASQSALKKITKNFLDENTDPTKLRIAREGTISKVVGSGKLRKYVEASNLPPAGEVPNQESNNQLIGTGTEVLVSNHPTSNVVVDVSADRDNCQPNFRRKSNRRPTSSTRKSTRVSRLIKELQQGQMCKHPSPQMVKPARHTLASPPDNEKPHFMSFAQVSLSPKVLNPYQPRVTCSPMRISSKMIPECTTDQGTLLVQTATNKTIEEEAANECKPLNFMGRGTFVVDSTTNGSNTHDVQLLCGRDTSEVEKQVIRLDSPARGNDDVDNRRGTFSIPLKMSNRQLMSLGASSRRDKIIARVKARASIVSSENMSIVRLSSAFKELTPEAMQLEQSTPVAPVGSTDVVTEDVTDTKSVIEKNVERYNLKEAVVVLQDLATENNSHHELSLETPTADECSRAPKKLTNRDEVCASSSSIETAGTVSVINKGTKLKEDSPRSEQEGSFVSCEGVSSVSNSVISNTPSPVCPSSKIVRPKLYFSSKKKSGSGKKKSFPAGNLMAVAKKMIDRATDVKVKRLQGVDALKKHGSIGFDPNRNSLVRSSSSKKTSVIGHGPSTSKNTPLQKPRLAKVYNTPTIGTPMENRRTKKDSLSLVSSQIRSEEVSRKRQALITQKVEENKRKRAEKTKKVREAQDKQRKILEEKAQKLLQAEEQKFLSAQQQKREQDAIDRQNRIAEQRRLHEERLAEKMREKERVREQEIEFAKFYAAQKLEKARAKQLELERIAREKETERTQQQERLAREEMQKQKEACLQKSLAAETLNNKLATAAAQVLKPGPGLNVTFDCDKPEASPSYDMTPQQILPLPNKDPDNYDLADMKEDLTDDESQPRKVVPAWATGRLLKIALLDQIRNPRNVLEIFPKAEVMPEIKLSVVFSANKPRYNKRGSSAQWSSPVNRSS